jgi:hypothetical protein
VHPDFLPLRAKEVLFYILHELKNAKSQPQDQEQDQGSDHQGEGGSMLTLGKRFSEESCKFKRKKRRLLLFLKARRISKR